jgi:hypothetical protein
MDFGFYDTTAITSTSDLVWIDVLNDETYGNYWWNNVVSGLRFRP